MSRANPARALVLGLCLSLLAGAAAMGSRAAGKSPSGELIVLRVAYDNIEQLSGLARYDIWSNDLAAREVVLGGSAAELEALSRTGWQVRVDQPETARLTGPETPQAFFGGYRTVDELYADLDAYADTYPSLVTLHTYGASHCKQSGDCVVLGDHALPGHDLRAMRLTNVDTPGSSTLSGAGITRGTKPVFFLMANIHAREITTPELVMRFAGWLLEGYGTDPDATWMMDHHEIWIVPTANPDGHRIVEIGEEALGNPFYHRKNYNIDSNGDGDVDCEPWWPGDITQFGVDLNRNHSFKWGTPGASTDPCDLTFRGPSAASEPEVDALQALVSQLIADQRGPNANDAAPDTTSGLLISVHSYGNLVLWPWGYQGAGEAPNRSGLQAMGDRFAVYSNSLSCQPIDCLYAASGTTDDWAYGELGIPAFTFEVGDEFMPPFQDIDDVQWPGFGPAFSYAARIARAPYALAFGPDALDVVADGKTATLSAIVTDANNGGRPVVAAEYTIDTPPWAAGASLQPMEAVDGAFGQVDEMVSATLDLSGLTLGRHTVYVRGLDDQGHVGPVSAAFLEVSGELAYHAYLPAAIRP